MSKATDHSLPEERLPNQEALDAYLRGDSQYSKLYQSVEVDAVPADLDRAVLAEAGVAVTRRKGFAWRQVTPMLAIAATAVLTISIVMRSGLETSGPSSKQRQAESVEAMTENRLEEKTKVDRTDAISMPSSPPAEADLASPKKMLAPAPVSVAPAVAAPLPASRDARAKEAERAAATESRKNAELSEQRVTGARRQESLQDVPVAVSAFSGQELAKAGNQGVGQISGPRGTISPPAASTSGVDKSGAALNLEEVIITAQKRPAPTAAGPRNTVPVMTRTRADRKAEEQFRELNAPVWLAHIRNLRADGKTRDADREWDRFVKAYPNYGVEENDAARPAKPK